jgi:hypothetical protein
VCEKAHLDLLPSIQSEGKPFLEDQVLKSDMKGKSCMVVHTCDSSFLGGRYKDHSLRPARARP